MNGPPPSNFRSGVDCFLCKQAWNDNSPRKIKKWGDILGYRIEYNAVNSKKVSILYHNRKRITKLLLLLISLMILLILILPTCRSVIWHFLLPGDGAVTAAAIDGLVLDISEGQSITNAIQNFCREVIVNDG